MSPVTFDSPLAESPVRPRALTRVAAIGVVLGTLGVLGVFVRVTAILLIAPREMLEVQSPDEMIVGIATMAVGLVISTLLLIAAVGALNIQVWSPNMLRMVVALNVLFEAAALVYAILYSLPEFAAMIDNPPPGIPPAQVTMMKRFGQSIYAGMYIFKILAFVVQAAYAFFVFTVMRRADVKRVLASKS